MHNTNNDITFKNAMLKCSLCDYSNKYIFVKRRITITGAGDDAAARQADERNKDVIFKNFASFINGKSEINSKEVNDAKDIDIVISMLNLIEYSDNYSKTYGRLWQYQKVEPNENLRNYESFESKMKITKNSTLTDGNTKMLKLLYH